MNSVDEHGKLREVDVRPGAQRDTIRFARAGDRDAILAVTRASGLFSAEELADVETVLRASLDSTATEEQWLVDDTGADGVVGVAYYAPERLADGVWNLLMLVVRPDRQGRGRGAALVDRVERELVGRARVLLIETSGTAEFAAQRAFYAGLGYRLEARIREFYGPADDKIVYWKRVPSEGADCQVRAPRPPTRGAGDARGAAPTRVAEPADLRDLLTLAGAFYREDGFTTAPEVLAGRLEVLVGSPAAHVTVAPGPAEPVGFAITTTGFGLEDGPIAELEDLYVARDARGRGLGRALLTDSVAWARAHDCRLLEVVVAPGTDRHRLLRYYREAGFADPRELLRRPLD